MLNTSRRRHRPTVDASSYVAHGGWRRISPLHAAGTYLEVIPNARPVWTNEESEDADQMGNFARADAAAVMH